VSHFHNCILDLFFRGDTTKTGHILGPAKEHAAIGPERELTPAFLAATRLMLHMAMFLGSARQLQVN